MQQQLAQFHEDSQKERLHNLKIVFCFFFGGGGAIYNLCTINRLFKPISIVTGSIL